MTTPRNQTGSDAETSWWAGWQSTHTGAEWPVGVLAPVRAACPCDDWSNVSSTPAWHLPQVSAMFARLIVDCAESGGKMRCAPWQSLHVADTTSPAFVIAVPCTVL